MAAIQRGLDECFKHRRDKKTNRFIVTDPRTKQSRRVGLGPSLALARVRNKVLRRSGGDFYFPWLLRPGATTNLCKDLGDAKLDTLFQLGAPADLPQDVWDEVVHHLQAIRGGLIFGVAMPKLK